MKTKFNQLQNKLKTLWADESAQGATEYILLLVVVVGLAMVFKDKMRSMVVGKMESISTDVTGFTKE